MLFSSNRPDAHRLPVARRWVAGLLCLHVLAIVLLTVSPRLHHWIHPDADDDDHDCAVVLFLHGGSHVTPLAVVHAPTPHEDFALLVLVRVAGPSVRTVFSLSRIFEHAPPATA